MLINSHGSGRIRFVWSSSELRVIEIRECQTSLWISDTGQRLRHRIARLVMPEPEVVDLDSANAHQDSQNFRVGRLEGQRRIQARPTLLDECKVKARRVCNRLYPCLLRGRWGTGWVGVGGVSLSFSGMAGWFSMVKGPLKFASKSGFFALRYRVYQLRSTLSFMQVCQPSDVLGARRLTTGQGPERVQIDWLFPLRDQVCVQKGRMAQFIVGVISDVLRHITIKIAQSVGWISA